MFRFRFGSGSTCSFAEKMRFFGVDINEVDFKHLYLSIMF